MPGGEALVHTQSGDSVLVAGAIPGEELRIRITGRRRGVLRGAMTDIVQASEQRTTPACPVANECGGCALQHIRSACHAEIKSEWVRQAFAPVIHEDTNWQPCRQSTGLRRRVRWFVGHDQEGTFLGFRARASHRPVRHETCPVIEPRLSQARQQLEASLPAHISSVQGICLDNGMHIILEGEQDVPVDIPLPEIGEVQWWWRSANAIRPLNQPVLKLFDRLPAAERDVHIHIGPNDFIQGNRKGNRSMVRQVQQWIPDGCRHIVDLFCGAGNLSLPAARVSGARVFGAEGSADSIRQARRNAAHLQVQGHFEVINLFDETHREDWVGADVLILDPPRKGARRLCRNMHLLIPARIIMVSCDVAAGARDAKILAAHGYHLTALRALDLFPFAGHVETMSLWQR